MSREIRVSLTVSEPIARLLLTAGVLAASAVELASETLTLSTYYPAPLGIYRELVTTGAGPADTILSRDAGNTIVGTMAPVAGYKLNVQGSAYATADFRAGGDLRSDAYRVRLGAAQQLWGDNSSALYWINNHSTVTQLLMQDAQGTTYGRVYGDGDGANFGLLDGDGNWSYFAQKDIRTELRVNDQWRFAVTGTRAEVRNYLLLDADTCSVENNSCYTGAIRAAPNDTCDGFCASGQYATWTAGIYQNGRVWSSSAAPEKTSSYIYTAGDSGGFSAAWREFPNTINFACCSE